MAKYCPDCHVKLENHHEICPLCSSNVQDEVPQGEIQLQNYPDDTATELEPTMDYRKMSLDFWEIYSVVSLLSLLIVFFIDIIGNAQITWSRFVVLSVTAGWAILTAITFLLDHIKWLFLTLTASLLLFLLALDYFINWQLSWFLELTMPLTLLSIGVIASIILTKRLIPQVALYLAVVLIYGGFYTLLLDLVIIAYKTERLAVTWSVYVMVPVILVSAFLIYFHYRFLNDDVQLNKLKAKFMI